MCENRNPVLCASAPFQFFRYDVVIGHRVLLHQQSHLFVIVQAAGFFRLVARLVQGRQQHRRKDRDDRNYHQQLDQRKIPAHTAGHVSVPGAFSSLHFLVLYLVTHFYLRHKSVVFLLKAIT